VAKKSTVAMFSWHRSSDAEPVGLQQNRATVEASRNLLGDLQSAYFAGSCAMRLGVSIFERTRRYSLGRTIADLFTPGRSAFFVAD